VVLTVGVLGPLEVSVDGRPVRLTSAKLRTLLVVLAMAAGSPLPVDRLASALWDDDDLPDHVRRVVQTYLGRLRGALGAGTVITEPAGYRLRVDPEQVDALRFTRLLETAAQARDPASEQARLDEALALWRGGPFDGVPSDWLARSETPRLVERYLAAVERRIDLDLAGGRPGERVAQLQELTARHPLRESLWVRLLVALDRCGRSAEALARYEEIRVRLAEELGTDPAPELQRVYADLLAGRRTRPEVARAVASVVPRQLPADIDTFTGRTAALKELLAVLGDSTTGTAVVISAISGTAGVGKTALAVHWAHRVADRFPDGQLYVNLRGFHPSGHAMAPADAVRGFLSALGVTPSRMPPDPDSQIGLYRSLLAGKRMLVVLDNARDPDQVRPLLPGSGTCLVLVTSRNQLTGLVAAESARPLVLDLLPASEARELLARRLGHDRVVAEPAAVEEIVSWCAGLPLALAVAAARAATRPALPLSTVAAQLRDARSRLDMLGSGDPTADARAVFSWSYQALSPAAARLFRLTGLHPGPDLTATAAASLAGVPVGQVRPLLAELTGTRLLTEPSPGRYGLHDLLRAYANELAETDDGDTGGRAAIHRLLDHYVQTGHTAARLLNPHRKQITVAPPQPGVTVERFAGQEQVVAWFIAERQVLRSAVELASRAELTTLAWQLVWTLVDFIDLQDDWHSWTDTHQTALDAARRSGDRRGEAVVSRMLGNGYARLGRHADAETQLRQALELYRQLDDHAGQGRTHYSLAQLTARRGNRPGAVRHFRLALDTYRAAANRVGEARVLNALGWSYTELGDYPQALAYCEEALALHQQTGDRLGAADTWDTLGYAHQHLGHHDEAAACFQRAIDAFHDAGSRYPEAGTLDHLGDARLAAGDADAARIAWQRALSILDELGHPGADLIRGKLRGS
jgi:DNA-binding SARP family transcriptional activator/tetratricopeptide (TPR) repeat protein